VSNYFEYFKLAAYLKRATNGAIVIAMGVPAVQQLFDPKFYTHLEGGSMEVSQCTLICVSRSVHKNK
jgi:hypothetical protein